MINAIKRKLPGLCACILYLGTALAQDGAVVKKAQRPNVVIVMADDLDSRQLSCYGGENLRTPHIDALASQGMRFNQMIASEAMCVPTRASLFTGLYPVRHGAFQNHKPVNEGVKSICHYLGDLGYEVALTGKDHVTKPESIFPFRIIKGFETNCVSPTDDYSLADIREFILNRAGQPYCLFIMSNNPHAPWTVGDPSEFRADDLVLPPHWVDTRDVRMQFTKYLAEVRRLDNQVGDVMALLKETGQEDNTVFIFLGEQGPQFPGGKWTLWDNGQKSSMIVRWPGKVKPKSHSEAIVQYEDITPTLVAMAGGQPLSGLDGRSFLPVLLGQSMVARDYAYGIHNNQPEGPAYPIRSVRDGRYKLILNLAAGQEYYIKYMMNPAKKNSYWNTWTAKAETSAADRKLVERIVHRPAVEFYDLQKDPYELNNLANLASYQDLVKRYRAQLAAWMEQQGDEGAAIDKNYIKEKNEH